MKQERAVNPIKSIGRSRASLVQQNGWPCFRASALFLLMLLISGCETKTNQIDQNRRDQVVEAAPQKLKSTNDQTMGRDDLILVSYFPFPGANICPFMVDAHSPYCLKLREYPKDSKISGLSEIIINRGLLYQPLPVSIANLKHASC